jgi:hypothetical protein
VTDDLLPPGLAGLPEPWNRTRSADRAAALAEGSPAAAAVLDRVLGELPALRAARPDDDELPAGLGEYFDFTAAGLAEQIPTLDGLTVAALTAVVRGWIEEDPDPAAVVALGRRWVASVARQLAVEAIRETPPVEVAAVLGRHLARLDPDTASYLLAVVGPVREHPFVAWLADVAADEALDAEVRDQASRMLVAVGEAP